MAGLNAGQVKAFRRVMEKGRRKLQRLVHSLGRWFRLKGFSPTRMQEPDTLGTLDDDGQESTVPAWDSWPALFQKLGDDSSHQVLNLPNNISKCLTKSSSTVTTRDLSFPEPLLFNKLLFLIQLDKNYDLRNQPGLDLARTVAESISFLLNIPKSVEDTLLSTLAAQSLDKIGAALNSAGREIEKSIEGDNVRGAAPEALSLVSTTCLNLPLLAVLKITNGKEDPQYNILRKFSSASSTHASLDSNMDGNTFKGQVNGAIQSNNEITAISVNHIHIRPEDLINQYLDSIERTLRPRTAFNTSPSSKRDQCSPGTRLAQLEQLQAWDDNGPRCFWITGRPGDGKTTLCATIASLEQKKRKKSSLRIVLRFFISQTVPQTAAPSRLFPSLAMQLANASPLAAFLIHQALQNDQSIIDDELEQQASALFVEPLISVAVYDKECKFTVIISGIDELEDSRKDISAILIKASCRFPKNVKLILSSLVEEDIRGYISTLHVRHIDLSRANPDDVGGYVRSRFRQMAYQHGKEWPPHEKLNALLTQADGLFLYAATATTWIENEMTAFGWEHTDKVLDDMTALKVAGLDKLYGLILTKVCEVGKDGDEERKAQLHELQKEIIGCLRVLQEPLDIAAIERILKALGKTRDLVTFFRRYRCLFVSGIDVINGQTIPCMHRTFFDFIAQRAKLDFRVDVREYHAVLAMGCLSLITSSNEQLKPVLDYALRWFPTHEMETASIDPTEKFFRSGLVSWLALLNKRDSLSVSSASEILKELKSHVNRLSSQPDIQVNIPLADNHSFSAANLKATLRLGEPLPNICRAILSPDGACIVALLRDSSSCHIAKFDPATGEETSRQDEDVLPTFLACGRNGEVIGMHDDEKFSPLSAPTKDLPENVEACFRSATTGHQSQDAWNIHDSFHTRHLPTCYSIGTPSTRCLSPNGEITASRRGDNVTLTLDQQHGRTLTCFNRPTAVAFSTGSGFFSTGLQGGTIQLFETKQGKALASLVGHIDDVLSVAFFPDGDRIISASKDQTIRIWDVHDILQSVNEPEDFRADGNWALDGGGNRLFWTPIPFKHRRNTVVIGGLYLEVDFSELRSVDNDSQ